MSLEALDRPTDGGNAFRHEAFFYAGETEFVDAMSAFIRDGVVAGEPVLVVVSHRKIDLLRNALGRDTKSVEFADMATVGANPGRIIPAWQDFVSAHEGSGIQLRGIGEPIGPDRTSDELVECHRHESLLNFAFDGGATPWRLVCPYDTTALAAPVVDEARVTHPFVHGGAPAPSDRFRPIDFAAGYAVPLPEPTAPVVEWTFDHASLRDVRDAVRVWATRARLSPTRRDDLVLAVNELAANSLRHGGGAGVLRAWYDARGVICEVRDRGFIREPLVGRVRPPVDGVTGRGLWLANHLCDLMQIRSTAEGTVVRLHMRDSVDL